MATILFDVNALVYWCFVGSNKHEEVSCAVRNLIMSDADILACTSSLNEAYYTLAHHCDFSEKEARQAIANIVDVFSLAPTDARVVRAALVSDEPDYEDAIVRACAELNQVDALVSYDKKAFRGSPVPKITAHEVCDFISKITRR